MSAATDTIQPANVDVFEDLDIEAVPTGMAVAWSIDNFIERPGIAHWMTEMDRIGDVQEIELTANDVVGKALAELGGELSDDCYTALVSRGSESRVPYAEDVLEDGNHSTVIERKETVRDAIFYWCPACPPFYLSTFRVPISACYFRFDGWADTDAS